MTEGPQDDELVETLRALVRIPVVSHLDETTVDPAPSRSSCGSWPTPSR